MASFNYVIVTPENATKLGVSGVRTTLSNGNVVLTQSDFSTQVGETLWDRVKPFDGKIVSEGEVFMLINKDKK